jgi:hypothetical protein
VHRARTIPARIYPFLWKSAENNLQNEAFPRGGAARRVHATRTSQLTVDLPPKNWSTGCASRSLAMMRNRRLGQLNVRAW